MSRENYQAWHVDPRDFSRCQTEVEQLRFLIRFAILAPSSHNSQPWRFSIRGNRILLRANLDRALPASDSNHRQLFLSLGCALENLLVAADYYGFETTVSYLPEGSAGGVAVEVACQRGHPVTEGSSNHLIFVIPERSTNRNKYLSRFPPQGFLDAIVGFGSGDVRIDLVSEQAKKEAVALVVSEALIAAMDDRSFRRELSQYIRANTTRSKIGMPMFGFGMPTPLSFFAPFLLRHFNVNRLTRKQDLRLL
ncbi:MAG: hypothetical protein AAB393_15760, partial [Bacteroidota bacterium]